MVTPKKDRQKTGEDSAESRSLRSAAERKSAGTSDFSARLAGQTPDEIIHELRVHQIELEMQADELRKIQNDLEVSRSKYLDLYELAPVGYLTLSETALVTKANLTAATLLGVDRNALVSARIRNYIVPEDRDSWDRYFVGLKRPGSTRVSTLTLVRGDGSPFSARLTGVPLVPDNGSIAINIAISDITDLRAAEKIREHLIEELRRKNAELDQFTHTISHDLKSPLLSIRAFVSLLDEDTKSGDTVLAQRDMQRISSAVGALENRITSLLALSRGGRVVDAPVTAPFADLARAAAGLLDSALRKRGVTLVIPDPLPEISGDQQRLLQVITDLLDNAIKFMGDRSDARIEIGVRNDAGMAVFFVRDNGIGIKKEYLPRIFGLFERLNQDVPGTGVGLATAKRIIEAHGGNIWAESEGEGRGTTICFTVPAPDLSRALPAG